MPPPVRSWRSGMMTRKRRSDFETTYLLFMVVLMAMAGGALVVGNLVRIWVENNGGV